MLNKFFNKKKDNKGFTLVELVIVVAILAILVGLLAPQYTKYVERSRKAADASNLDSLVTAVKVAAADQSYSDLIPTAKTDVVITIKSSGTTAVYGTAEVKSGATGGAGALFKAFSEFAGNEWAKTTLKSNAWPKIDEDVAIQATCTISPNGSVTVVFNPDDVKNKVKED